MTKTDKTTIDRAAGARCLLAYARASRACGRLDGAEHPTVMHPTDDVRALLRPIAEDFPACVSRGEHAGGSFYTIRVRLAGTYLTIHGPDLPDGIDADIDRRMTIDEADRWAAEAEAESNAGTIVMTLAALCHRCRRRDSAAQGIPCALCNPPAPPAPFRSEAVPEEIVDEDHDDCNDEDCQRCHHVAALAERERNLDHEAAMNAAGAQRMATLVGLTDADLDDRAPDSIGGE